MKHETLSYKSGEITLKGHLVYDPAAKEKRPAVLVAHAWRGQDEFARKKAEELANLGYVGFAVDLYGDGVTAQTDEEALALMVPLFLDRKTLQNRIIAAYETLIRLPFVDKDRVGAIGFCFGGLTVIELLRSALPVRGVVSFHGVLGDRLKDLQAVPAIRSKSIKGSILILHGHDDPLVTQEDISNLQQELTQAGADWQMNIYGNTAHAFTNPEAHQADNGLVYNERTARRAWRAMTDFFTEIMG